MFRQQNKTILGIYLAIATAAMLALNDVLIRSLLTTIPFYELIFIRSIFIVGILSIFFALKRYDFNLKAYLKGDIFLRLLRAISLSLSGLLFFYAALIIPITSATAFALSFPILVCFLARIFLGEKIGLDQFCYLILGFTGSLLIIQPSNIFSNEDNLIAHVAAATAGVSLSIYFVATRYCSNKMGALRLTIEPQIFLIFISVMFFFATENNFIVIEDNNSHTKTLLATWLYPSTSELLPLLTLCLNGLGLFFLTIKSYTFAKATVLAPYEFFIIPFTMIIAFFVVNEIPNLMQAVGALLVFISLFQIKKYRGEKA